MHLIASYIGIILYIEILYASYCIYRNYTIYASYFEEDLKKKEKKKDLMLYLLIKWYFRKASYILRIFIRFQIKTNIKVVIFLDIKIA